ncbi:unnamed protein product [Aphanomyces euteiches]
MQHGGSATSATSSASQTTTSSHVSVQASELSGPVSGVLLRIGDTNILLNCGDPSPATPTQLTSFSATGISPGTVISAILLTDWRVSSSGMLPAFLSTYLNHHNRKGKDKLKPPSVQLPAVFLTHATRALLPSILKECKGKDANPSFLNDATLATVAALGFSQPHSISVHNGNSKLTVTAYRSGHAVGGCLYSIELHDIHITFADGFNINGSRILLPADLPQRPPHVTILNSSYVVEVSETRTVLEREVCKEIHDTLVAKGKVIIPVFGAGCFFHDMVALLQDYWACMRFDVPMYVTSDVLLAPAPLLSDSYTSAFLSRSPSSVLTKLPDWKLLQEPNQPMVIFSAGASVSAADTAQVLLACGNQHENLLVLSEFRTKGTVNYAFLNNISCPELTKSFLDAIVCRLHTFPCGDEVDAREVVELARQSRPTECLLLRGADANDPFLLEALAPHLPSSTTIASLQNEDDLWTSSIPRDLTVRLRANLAFQGGVLPLLVLAESRKTLFMNNESSGLRRLKKKKHSLAFGHTWKYTKGGAGPSQPKQHKRRQKASGFGLSMLLSNEQSDGDDDADQEASEAQANVSYVLDAVAAALHQWLGFDPASTPGETIAIDRQAQWLHVASVQVSVSPDWSLTMNWSYEDEELASRIYGLTQRVIEQQYREAQEGQH